MLRVRCGSILVLILMLRDVFCSGRKFIVVFVWFRLFILEIFLICFIIWRRIILRNFVSLLRVIWSRCVKFLLLFFLS